MGTGYVLQTSYNDRPITQSKELSRSNVNNAEFDLPYSKPRSCYAIQHILNENQ